MFIGVGLHSGNKFILSFVGAGIINAIITFPSSSFNMICSAFDCPAFKAAKSCALTIQVVVISTKSKRYFMV